MALYKYIQNKTSGYDQLEGFIGINSGVVSDNPLAHTDISQNSSLIANMHSVIDGSTTTDGIIEGFGLSSIFGGGSSAVQSLTEVNTAISNTINEQIVSSTQNCNNKASGSQLINLECNESDAVKTINAQLKGDCIKDGGVICLAAFNAAKDDPTAAATLAACMKDAKDGCFKAYVSCNFQDISQDSIFNFSTSCKMDSKTIADIQNNIVNTIDKKSNDTTDAMGKSLDDAVNGLLGNSTSDTKNIKNQFITNIKNSMKKELIQNITNSFQVNQSISFKGSSSNVQGISQKTMLNIITDATSKDTDYMKAYQDLANVAKTDDTKTVKGITDIAETAGKTINGVVDTAGKTVTDVSGNVTGILKTPLIILAVFVGLAAIVGGVIYISKMSKGADSVSSLGKPA
ncbi:MAG: hypothetical protein Faunusvirus32_6 [Faunusvirus sp.]|jgi:hypothetical protein|uniref:Uncharacterized protein n=1 Tax=Faunusvirus sp. TaxID=2487766 RepID=A0A3G4ZZB7_9VIRU|nr:MAG: hypothetical protein Faunusvirus32_6 [Faunusvirus sp.]